MIELQKIYAKIAKPLAIVFAAFALLILIDFVLPREVYFDSVGSQDKGVLSTVRSNSSGRVYRPYRKTLSHKYTMTLSGQEIETDEAGYRYVYTEDPVEVYKTRILRRITDVRHLSDPIMWITIYVPPYTYFPLYPLMLLLPIIFAFITGDTWFLRTARPFSHAIALLFVLLCFF